MPLRAVRDPWHDALMRSKVGMTEERFLIFRQEVALAMASAMADRRAEAQRRAEKATGTLVGLDAAIGARISTNALLALQNDEDGAPDGVEDPILFQLIELRRDVVSEVGAARSLLAGGEPAHTRRSRKLSLIEEALIERLARAWMRHVNPSLSLPRRDPNPTSPLLRFLDAMMEHAFGINRPEAKTVLTFLADHLRPAIAQGGVSAD